MKYKKHIKCILFLILGITLFCVLHRLFMPKWYYPDSTLKEPTRRILTGIYDDPSETIDIVFLGTSHMIYGLAPIELYEKYGIKSYNLAGYYGAAEPPVRCGESHLSGLTEPPIDSYSA